MKKVFSFLFTILLVLSMTSCVSTKKIRYFQGADSLYVQAQRISQQYEMRLKPADQVYIKLTCSDPELLDVFSQGVILGGTSSNQGISSNVSGNNAINPINAFTIDNQGELNLPRLGRIKVSGLTVEEASRLVEQRIAELGIVTAPEVHVYLLNARVTVLGAVSRPGVISLTSERNTILDILAQCGDVDDTGLRYKVRLFREENGERRMYEIDLTNADIFQSRAFYVQQNDLIYVEHNKSKTIKTSPFYTFLSAGSSILGVIMTAISLVFLIKK